VKEAALAGLTGTMTSSPTMAIAKTTSFRIGFLPD
jgi:hypothetical protein